MPKGKTKTAVIALALAIKPKIGMRVFVNLNDFTVWRAELITTEGVELGDLGRWWRGSSAQRTRSRARVRAQDDGREVRE